MSGERTPVTTVAELDTLDDAEIIEGYFDGKNGEPAPGDNRSKSYWHGWRNGRVDGHHDKGDAAMTALIRDVQRNGGMLRAKGQYAPDLTPRPEQAGRNALRRASEDAGRL